MRRSALTQDSLPTLCLCKHTIPKAPAYFTVHSSHFSNLKKWLMTCIHWQEYHTEWSREPKILFSNHPAM